MSKAIRQIRIEGNIAYVPLTQGYEAVIDAADVPLVEGRTWRAMPDLYPDGSLRTVYAAVAVTRDGRRTTLRMHRVINNTPDDLHTDHIDGDGLNNRRINLRAATLAQNRHNMPTQRNNTSGVKGVSWHKRSKKWYVNIRLDGKLRFLGSFINISDAAAAYAAASVELHGDFGRVA